MNSSNPYQAPSAELDTPIALAVTPTDRKRLVPTWIKVFGWLFIIMGAFVPVLAIVMQILGQPASYSIFGLEFQGSPFHPMALLISAIMVALAISAYGLLFGRSWGLNACLATGYLGVATCLFTMSYVIFATGNITFRLELLVQIPYLMRLNKIKPYWQ